MNQGKLKRVLRGGNWHVIDRRCRSAHRRASEPGRRYGNIGFRVARGKHD